MEQYKPPHQLNFVDPNWDRKESIRDQFVAGILNKDLAEKIELLYSKDGVLTLGDVVECARRYNNVHEGRKREGAK
ncbi:hypothetical protein SK128_011356 [Halocaridina rubra]|uniref:Uncharacterized protein n=1 Tax=Halocaridina rubra TaxID=373956 RepID=A0AAN9AHG6_HALRR